MRTLIYDLYIILLKSRCLHKYQELYHIMLVMLIHLFILLLYIILRLHILKLHTLGSFFLFKRQIYNKYILEFGMEFFRQLYNFIFLWTCKIQNPTFHELLNGSPQMWPKYTSVQIVQ